MKGGRRDPSPPAAPPAARRLVHWSIPASRRAPVLGDLEERFAEHARRSPARARFWYWKQAASLTLHYAARRLPGMAAALRSPGQDLRWAWRAARRSPGTSGFVVLTLALGLGILLVTVAAVRDVVMPADVFRAQARTFQVWPEHPMSVGELQSLRDESKTFESLGGLVRRGMTMQDDEDAWTANGALVSPELMTSLRTGPLYGTQLQKSHEQPGGERVALLSEGLWRRRFAADPGVVGTRVRIDGTLHTILGVLPAGLPFPDPGSDVILPLPMDPSDPDFWPRRELTVIGRVREGVDPGQARDDLRAAAGVLARRWPTFFGDEYGADATLRPVGILLFGGARERAVLLLAAVAVVFLTVCANLGGLTLMRSLPRGLEFGTRAALGAGKGRIVRQLLGEHLLLGALGGTLAVALTTPLGALLGLVVPELATPGRLGPAGAAAGMALAVGASGLFGLPAVFELSRRRMAEELAGHHGIAHTGGSLQALLVAAQIGLVCALVAATAMLGRTVLNLRAVETGLDPDGVTAVRIETPRTLGATDLGTAVDAALERIRGLPGTAAAGAVAATPYDQDAPLQPVNREDHQVEVGEAIRAEERVVTPGTLELLGIDLLAGRTIEAGDGRLAPRVVVVNRTLARDLWPETPAEAVPGRRIAVDPHDWDGWVTVVGVVEDTRPRNLTGPPPPQFFLPREQAPRRAATFLIRGLGGEGGARSLVDAVRADAPEVTVAWTRPLSELLLREWSAAASAARLFAVLGVTALALCAFGVYGMAWTAVRRRRHELAVRKVMGATGGSVVLLVARSAALLAACGLTLGVLATFLVGRALRAFLFGVSGLDPLSLLAAAAVATVTVMAATALPALWAARLAPAQALRSRA